MNHLAIPVTDEQRSRRFYETYLGFAAKPARRHPDGVLMLYNADGFALALGPATEPVQPPTWMHFGLGVSEPTAVRELRLRLIADGLEPIESWDEPEYANMKVRDPDGYIVEVFWEP